MFNQYGDILTLEELCDALMIGKNRAYNLLNTNDIKGFKIGKIWKIPKSALIDFVLEQNSIQNNFINQK